MPTCHPNLIFSKLISILLACFTLAACLSATDATDAPAEKHTTDALAAKHTVDVPADTIENASKTLSYQTGASIIVSTNTVRGLRTKPVKGEYTAREALEIMLADTGLVIEQTAKSGILTVLRAKDARDAKKMNHTPNPPPSPSPGACSTSAPTNT